MAEETTNKNFDLSDTLVNQLAKYVSDADQYDAAEHVAAVQAQHAVAKKEELVDLLIKQKCLRAGAVGAVTAGASIIPGLGTIASMTFGVAADIGMTFKLQSELVLEMAAVHGHELSKEEKSRVLLLVTGISAGGNQVLGKVGQQIAKRATERLVQKSVSKAIPFIGVATSAGINIASTYVIGKRADAYFRLGEDQMENWGDSLRAISGVDERLLADWLSETTQDSWAAMSRGMSGLKSSAVSMRDWTSSALAGAGRKAINLFKWKTDRDDEMPPNEPEVVAVIGTEDEDGEEVAEMLNGAETQLASAASGETISFFSGWDFFSWVSKNEETVVKSEADATEAEGEEDPSLLDRAYTIFQWDRKEEDGQQKLEVVAKESEGDEEDGLLKRTISRFWPLRDAPEAADESSAPPLPPEGEAEGSRILAAASALFEREEAAVKAADAEESDGLISKALGLFKREE